MKNWKFALAGVAVAAVTVVSLTTVAHNRERIATHVAVQIPQVVGTLMNETRPVIASEQAGAGGFSQ
jgi:hypothetical protein